MRIRDAGPVHQVMEPARQDAEASARTAAIFRSMVNFGARLAVQTIDLTYQSDLD
jgi:hypothetical protein